MSSLSPEFRLLGACLAKTAGANPGGIIEQICREGLDGDTLMRLARDHRMTQHLYFALKDAPRIDVPSDLFSNLGERFRQNCHRNLVAAAELSQLARALAEEQVPLLAFKGPVLAKLVYGGYECREFDDLDILVPANEVSRVERLFEKLGYARTTRHSQVKHFQFYRLAATQAVPIELHWRLTDFPGMLDIDVTTLWDDAPKVTLGGAEVSTLPASLRILYLAYHGSYHAWYRLGWVADFLQALSVEKASQEELLDRATASGVRRCWLLALEVAKIVMEACDIESPAHAGARHLLDADLRGLARKMAAELTDPSQRLPTSNMRRFLQITDGSRLRGSVSWLGRLFSAKCARLYRWSSDAA